MALTPQEMFEQSGAVLHGHFLLASGLHSPVYWEKFQVLQFPQYTQELCRMMVDRYLKDNVQVVAGPTTGGVILAYEVARQLGVRGIFAEKKDGSSERAFRRGFNIEAGERVLLVDDILTTGGSVREVIAPIQEKRGNLIGIAVLVDRSEKGIDFGYPLFSCLRSPALSYKPEECPLCAAKVPLVKRGGS
jgi:orotate phosphoribosyltransferase